MHITEPARQTPLHGEYDVVVLGGGPAGLLAAASATRNGASVLLVERYGFLGGMGTAVGVSNFCGLHANVHGTIRQVVHGMTDELLDRMRALDGLNEPHLILGKIHAQAYDISAFKCAVDGLLRDSGAGVLFHALATGMRAAPMATWTRYSWKPSRAAARPVRVLIDCSGDADWRPGPACPLKRATPTAACSIPR
ncbi:FAD-dependent oxidoreductase [Achromobacter xylosoxidans]